MYYAPEQEMMGPTSYGYPSQEGYGYNGKKGKGAAKGWKGGKGPGYYGKGGKGMNYASQYPADWDFMGDGPVMIRQQMKMTELVAQTVGIDYDAKNKYVLENTAMGEDLLINEESNFFERQACGNRRELDFYLHAGPTKDHEVLLQMKKNFHCVDCCPLMLCMRPELQVISPYTGEIGKVVDPFNLCCNITWNIFDYAGNSYGGVDYTGQNTFSVEGNCCQCGFLFCPCCCDAEFEIIDLKSHGPSGRLVKRAGGIKECCFQGQGEAFEIFFPPYADAHDKQLLVGLGLLVDMVYFENGLSYVKTSPPQNCSHANLRVSVVVSHTQP
ncbi:unnamed protein product [Amoebophrya sp. A120]|nr:unnamed protein product [Amoebophrya sp. A120]|eukprot:GSA120T00012433001.1